MFKLIHQDKEARRGSFVTAHGVIETPVFMPVGTQATVKTLTQEHLENLQASIILGNTYHLYLRPGHQLIEQMGGLHKFMSWNRPILTDSGGYQVFSLKELRKISDEGVEFQSHHDGSYHFFSPEKVMEIQKALGSDIVMCFDECPAMPASDQELQKAVERTLAWAWRCKKTPLQLHQHLFGIVQGGLNFNLRQKCLEELSAMDFPGMALGGFSVGEKNQEMQSFLKEFVPIMAKDKPRYLMGVGTPLDILQAVSSGIDMFDCVLPTRNGRNGQALTSLGPLNIRNERFKLDASPLDPRCLCFVCQKYSRAYIRHLGNVGEGLFFTLMSYHNVHFYLNMMKSIRESIELNQFDDFYAKFYKDYNSNFWLS